MTANLYLSRLRPPHDQGESVAPDALHTNSAAESDVGRQERVFYLSGDACAAWLYPAEGNATTAPMLVMAHGLSGPRRDRLGPFAERFARAGIAALVFDHRGFGDSAGEPDLFHPARQLEDWQAAIAYARSLPGIDASRIATFGSSMGAG